MTKIISTKAGWSNISEEREITSARAAELAISAARIQELGLLAQSTICKLSKEPVITKICTVCKKCLPSREFTASAHCKSGLSSACRMCQKLKRDIKKGQRRPSEGLPGGSGVFEAPKIGLETP